MHVRQHYSTMYCPCQFSHPSRDSVYDHQKAQGRTTQHGGSDGPVYMVDEESYEAFAKHMEWEKPPSFGACIPH